MPRLLTGGWIKLVAINYLLYLYEKETKFVQEWDDIKRPFAPIIEQVARAGIINDIERLLARNPPRNFMTWVSDFQKLRDYVQSRQGVSDLSQLQESYDRLLDQLAPYILELNELAHNWKLRATWAGDELMWRDIHKKQQNILDVAGVTALFELSDNQIQTLLKWEKGSFPSDTWPINMLSLYLAGGRQGLINKLNKRLVEYEKDLKSSGAKELPSALFRHAEWWFQHHVYKLSFPAISRKVQEVTLEVGPYPENIQKEVSKFSKLLDIQLNNKL